MRLYFLILFLIPLLSVSQRRCTGSAGCGACTSCNYCKYCNAGGTCGVCGGGSRKSSSSDRSSRSRSNYNYQPAYTAPTPQYIAKQPARNNSYELYIKVKLANLRTAPSINSSIIGTIPSGTLVSILRISGSWYQVKVFGYTGYMHKTVF
jgi:uncharacterized protein YgiM (DUF1202 family)